MIKTAYHLDPLMFMSILDAAEYAPMKRFNVTREKPAPVGDHLQWVGNVYTDDPELIKDFEICGLRNIGLHFPEVVRSVTGLLTEWSKVEFAPTNFVIIRTKGDVQVHKDLGVHRCKFNFGIRNSHTARTWMHDENKEPRYYDRLTDGHGFLLDSSKFHSVVADKGVTEYRYFATFTTTLTASEVVALNPGGYECI